MKAQFTLTVSESKEIIAWAISEMPEVKDALKNGKIVLKGGTTVSAVAEKLVGEPLWISGRITPRGTKTSLRKKSQPHSILIEKNDIRNIDRYWNAILLELNKGDIVITGANALDVNGNAAIMAAAPLGGKPINAISSLMVQGVEIIIAVGLEKLIPCSIKEAVIAAGQQSTDKALGCAVGLFHLIGKVITEKEAIEMLANVKCTIIGSGGILGAEGATTMVIEGSEKEVEKAFKIVLNIKNAKTSGVSESLSECRPGISQCKRHVSCIYKSQ